MASIVDAFNEALSENFAYAKIVLYAIPVYFVVNFFMVGKMGLFYFWGAIVGAVILGLLTRGINNVRMNKQDILTLNPIKILLDIFKTVAVVVPHLLILGAVGKYLVNIKIPIELPHVQLIYSIIVWAILFSIVLTSYLSFAKYLKVWQGFNYIVILESCIDVFVSLLFFIPQLLFANIVLIGPIAYLFFYFQIPYTHWGFVAYCSAVFVINISIMANYLAQAAYEHIKGNNEEYDDNMNVNIIDDVAERCNGK